MVEDKTMVEDKELIRLYAAEGSERAFAELARRHLNMVYGAALRQVNGDTHLAQDVAQTVFTRLAARAAALQGATSIAGWLYSNTRFAAAKAVRAEARRRAREQAAVSMNEMNSNANAGWNELRPMIDEALSELGETDREAIVLRFFEAYEYSLVGAALGVSENAARMRVDRALEKLRGALQKRGLATTGAALAGALAESSSATVSAQLAAGITSAALAQAAATSAVSTSSILKLIAMKKLSLAAVGVLALSTAAVLVVRNSPSADPPTVTAAPKAAAQASPVQPGGAAPAAATAGDPDIFNKIVQRHDEQVRARGGQDAVAARAAWDKMMADFDDSMKEQPGVKKFGAARQMTLGADETLIMGGWSPDAGQRMLVFITPTMIDPAGNKVAPPFAAQSEIMIDSKFVSVSEQVLVKLGLQTLFTEQHSSTEAVRCSDTEFRSYINSIEQSDGADVLSAPRVTTLLGRQASVSVAELRMIAGKNQTLGPSLNLLAALSADGVSVDLDAIAQYAEAAPEAGQ